MTTPNNAAPARKPIFFGWYVCAAAIFIGFVAIGARNGLGVFIVPMEAEFGWNRLTISIAGAMGILVNGVTQPFMGQIFDKTGGRKLVLVSILIIGVTTILLFFTFHIAFLIVMFGMVAALAHGGSGLTNTATLMARWFRRQRARAIGLNSAALSLGGMIMVPFAMYLLQATGSWRIGWLGLGICVLFALPLAYLFIRESPQSMGLNPDGDPEPADAPGGGRPQRAAGPLEVDYWRDSFKSAPIWQMAGAYFVCGATTFIITVHFIPYALDREISGGTAALIFGYMNGLNIIGALAAGWLADKVGGTKNWLALVYLMRGAAYLMLLTIPSVAGLWIFATVAGFSWVATLPLTSSLTADVYGLRAMATISGITFMFHQFGGFFSVLLAGQLYDMTGSYTIPFAIAGSLLIPAAISAFTIRERKYSARYQQPTVAASAGD